MHPRWMLPQTCVGCQSKLLRTARDHAPEEREEVRRLRLWWRMWNHHDPDHFPGYWHSRTTAAKWADNMVWERRVEYVRKMSGGYPTGEKP